MNLKNILKQLKTYESSISTVLGFVVIVIIGLLVVNYFRNIDSTGEISNIAEVSTESLEATHTISEGESLWTIAETYYEDGFRWTEIMEANNITNPGDIEVGQELIIPDVESADVIADAGQAEDQVVVTETPEPTIEPTTEPTVEPTATPEVEVEVEAVTEVIDQPTDTAEEGTYTVVRGDNLWDIAVEQYGDGYRWSDIAEANDLVNPGTIHAGNVLVIPA